jgi:tetratricopeptide (TPR) repeat protein
LLGFIERGSATADLVSRLAELDVRRGDFESALANYRRVLELDHGTNAAEMALVIANLYERVGRPAEARPLLEQALESAPNDPRLRGALVSVLERVGDHGALAGLVLEEALQAPPSPERTAKLLRAGELLLAEGQTQQSIHALETARAEAPDQLDVVVALARAYTKAGRIENALKHLDDTLEAYRGKRLRALGAVYEEKANVHLEEGFLTDALVALSRAFEMDPKNARLGMRLGKLAFEAEETELAQRALRTVAIMKSAEIDGPEGARPETKSEANYALALMAHRTGDPRKAKILVTKALSENPAHEGARALMTELERR